MTEVHVVVPEGIDDPARPSGGNVYDRQVCRGLAALGLTVREHGVPGSWPAPDAASLASLAGVVGRITDGASVLIDGLVGCAAPAVLSAHARRLRLVLLVHMPLGHRPPAGHAEEVRRRERDVLSLAAAVITPSAWAAGRLRELYNLAPETLRVAAPGVDAAQRVTGTESGASLLCVAAVIADKGHDLLLDALSVVDDLPWRCICVGSLQREPHFAGVVRHRATTLGLSERVAFTGPRTAAELGRCYAGADALVHASRAETYGMVLAEALARGLPVIATQVGGVPEAVGHGDDGARPGLLVAPEDGAALGGALRIWLTDAALRRRLRATALQRRRSLRRWSVTSAEVAAVLTAAVR